MESYLTIFAKSTQILWNFPPDRTDIHSHRKTYLFPLFPYKNSLNANRLSSNFFLDTGGSSGNRGDIQRFRWGVYRLEGVQSQQSNDSLDPARHRSSISISRTDHHRGQQEQQQQFAFCHASRDPRIGQHYLGVSNSCVRHRHQQFQVAVSAFQAGSSENHARVRWYHSHGALACDVDHGHVLEMVAWWLYWKKLDVHSVLHRGFLHPSETGSRSCFEKQSGFRSATCYHLITLYNIVYYYSKRLRTVAKGNNFNAFIQDQRTFDNLTTKAQNFRFSKPMKDVKDLWSTW